MTDHPAAAPAGASADPQGPLSFTFEGRNIPAVAGQSIGAALYAAGVRVFSRSFKYHRPRGLFCVSGDCATCLMQVDGRPNVRTCVEPARAGQTVSHQNAWPGLGFDVLRTFDRLDVLLPVGFYYKRFHKPRWLWPIFEHTVRHIAGLGRVDVHTHPEAERDYEHLQADVCVVGGGPAGLAAASEALACGARVLLLEQAPRLGGHLLYDGDRLAEVEPFRSDLEGNSRARVLTGTTVFGLYEGNVLGAAQCDRLLKVRAKQIVVCTGGRQQPYLFHNNDLPGVMLGRGVQRLRRLNGVTAGSRAVVVADGADGHRLAEQLEAWGVSVAAVVATGPGQAGADGRGHEVLENGVVLRAKGNRHLKAVTVARRNGSGAVDERSAREIPCDLLCLASRLQPANELLLQAGARFRQEGGRWVMVRNVPGVAVAGAAGGTFDLAAQLLEGKLRGAQAAAALGHSFHGLSDHRSAWETAQDSLATPAPPSGTFLLDGGAGGKRFVCLCEDVTVKDIERAVAEGFDGIETMKRYTTVNMGPCQGKMCGATAAALCARATGQSLEVIGTTTSRPPVVPVEMRVLAAEQRHHPVRRTPLHHWHEAAGARWLDAGLWKRPESYGDPAAEVRAVRTGVGLIDVSTLGKLEVVGPDAAELLERVYLNRWADLAAGRSRYGAMCNEDGVLFDDGVAARLGPERFYLTATTGNADGVYQWLELWRTTWGLNVTVLNQTSAMAAMNLAGPRSREVLSQLTRMDASPAAFPYLALREGEVAGVPCRLLRIGFVGELGYEIHCPAAYAEHVWEALARAGAEFGVRPFGVEAQRILRLEKGHLIIGQDTDALSNPFDAGLGWMVRFDKPAFIGREPLLRLKEMGSQSRLVGFQMAETGRVPAEGSQVVEEGKPAGRVASARYSPTLNRSLGLAWVPASRAANGERFAVRWDGADVPAVVTALPFYDPEGSRLKA